MSWLRELVEVSASTPQVAHALTFAGLEVERIDSAAGELRGPIVVGRVSGFDAEPQSNGKTIRWCQIDVGPHNRDDAPARGIVCGADNFTVGDLVVVALPGAVLPGDFRIASRTTYGHVSDGMICASDELGLDGDHSGIMVLEAGNPGDDVLTLLGLDEEVLDIDLTPDLGYCLAMRGVARETAQAFEVPFADPVTLDVPAPTAGTQPVILDDDRCDLFVAVTVRGIDPDAASPEWLQRRIRAAGMRPISLTVDVSNYVMWELGQPNHTYDAATITGPIRVRRAEAGERLVTLDDAERTLDADDLVIADDSGPIGLAGVMGGAATEISGSTRDVVIEAAHFDPATVARGARRHKLPSEAAKRFERDVDPGTTYAAAMRVAELLVTHGGGQIDPNVTVAGEVAERPGIELDLDLPPRILGIDVEPARCAEVLRSSGVDVASDVGVVRVNPPSWRPDLADPIDYVEEVGRKIGLDRIPARLPRPAGGRGPTTEQRLRRVVADALAATGFVEVTTLPFMSEADVAALRITDREPLVALANPLGDDQPWVRSSLLPGLAEAVRRNSSRTLGDVALFEIGRVFTHTATSASTPAPAPGVTARPDDATLVAFARSLPAQPRHVAALAETWQRAIATALLVGGQYGHELRRSGASDARFHPGRRASLWAGESPVGFAGELHPQVAADLGLPPRTAYLDLDLDALAAHLGGPGRVGALSPHPATKEDVALIVDADVASADVARALCDGGGALLESVELFDVYTGEQAGPGKKSLAFALRLRAPDRTLKQADAAAARDAAVAEAARRTGAVQRVEQEKA